jgi:1,4-alpha-glucan branching enzyme
LSRLPPPAQWVTHIDEERQVLVAERGPLVFVFNFSPHTDYEGLQVAAPEPGKWRVAIDRWGGGARWGAGCL